LLLWILSGKPPRPEKTSIRKKVVQGVNLKKRIPWPKAEKLEAVLNRAGLASFPRPNYIKGGGGG